MSEKKVAALRAGGALFKNAHGKEAQTSFEGLMGGVRGIYSHSASNRATRQN
jgi:hypothetical protein